MNGSEGVAEFPGADLRTAVLDIIREEQRRADGYSDPVWSALDRVAEQVAALARHAPTSEAVAAVLAEHRSCELDVFGGSNDEPRWYCSCETTLVVTVPSSGQSAHEAHRAHVADAITALTQHSAGGTDE